MPRKRHSKTDIPSSDLLRPVSRTFRGSFPPHPTQPRPQDLQLRPLNLPLQLPSEVLGGRFVTLSKRTRIFAHSLPRSITDILSAYSPLLISLCQALYQYTAQYDDELSFLAGAVIALEAEVDGSWVMGRLGRQSGLAPLTYLSIVEPLPSTQRLDDGNQSVSGGGHVTVT